MTKSKTFIRKDKKVGEHMYFIPASIPNELQKQVGFHKARKGVYVWRANKRRRCIELHLA